MIQEITLPTDVIPAASRSDWHSGDPEKDCSAKQTQSVCSHYQKQTSPADLLCAADLMDPGCLNKPAACLRDDEKRAWVVFSGQTDLPWLKVLRPGFRHCYVLLNDGKHRITLDPLSNYTDICVHDLPADFDLPHWMQAEGCTIVPAVITHKPKQAPWTMFTCVEAVKRVLGIHSMWVLTPWQLYCHLRKDENHKIFNPQRHQNTKGDIAWEA